MMKIYTKTGDAGETSFFNSERVKKNDIRIQAYGDLDELNSILGLTITFIDEPRVREILLRIQHDIFTVSAELASLSSKNKDNIPKVTPLHVSDLEGMIDLIQDKLPEQKHFIIPGGTRQSGFLHLARCVTRRAERTIITINERYNLNPEILRYVNRLSDLLYMLARFLNNEVMSEQQPIYKYFENE